MRNITHGMLAKGQGKKYPGIRKLVLSAPREEDGSFAAMLRRRLMRITVTFCEA